MEGIKRMGWKKDNVDTWLGDGYCFLERMDQEKLV